MNEGVKSPRADMFPDVMGLQGTLLGQSLTYDIYQNKTFVQVIHNG